MYNLYKLAVLDQEDYGPAPQIQNLFGAENANIVADAAAAAASDPSSPLVDNETATSHTTSDAHAQHVQRQINRLRQATLTRMSSSHNWHEEDKQGFTRDTAKRGSGTTSFAFTPRRESAVMSPGLSRFKPLAGKDDKKDFVTPLKRVRDITATLLSLEDKINEIIHTPIQVFENTLYDLTREHHALHGNMPISFQSIELIHPILQLEKSNDEEEFVRMAIDKVLENHQLFLEQYKFYAKCVKFINDLLLSWDLM